MFPNSFALTVGLVRAAPRGSGLLEPILIGELMVVVVLHVAVDVGRDGDIVGAALYCSRVGVGNGTILPLV
jgi:hypothetical protein